MTKNRKNSIVKTAVVILNWNTKGFLEEFLPPLIDSTEGLDAEVVVADSASTDGSMEMMTEKFPSVRQIPLDKNYGFTGGYNRALAMIDAEYYILINSDVEVPKDWLSPLVEWMDSHPECGVCGPKLRSWHRRDMFEYAGAAGGCLDRYGYPFCRGRVMNKIEKDTGQYDSPANVLWVSGACLMVRASLWKSLGGLDDRFFAHMEEIDFCWRIQLEGYKVTVVPSSIVYHIGGGTLPKESPYKLFLNYRNDLLMLENNLPRTIGRKKAKRRIRTRMILDGLSGAVYLFTGKWESFKAVIKAHREFRKLRRNNTSDARANIDGLVSYWMIPRNLLFLQK